MPTIDALNASNSVTLLGYSIWDQRVEEHFDRGGDHCEWEIICKWSDRIGLRAKIMGGATLVGGVVTMSLSLTHPDYPWMISTSVHIEQVAGNDGLSIGPTGMVATKYAKLTISFLTFDPTEVGDEKIDFSGHVMTVPNGTFQFGTGTNAVKLLSAESPGIVIPRATLQRTLRSQPSIPVAVIFGLIGKVNNAPFLGGATETILYMGASSQRRFTSIGAKQWDIVHSLTYDPNNWNFFINPVTSAWARILRADGTTGAYLTGDMTALGFSV